MTYRKPTKSEQKRASNGMNTLSAAMRYLIDEYGDGLRCGPQLLKNNPDALAAFIKLESAYNDLRPISCGYVYRVEPKNSAQ
jgi:hypothetical protein